jgi:transmembrane sensor
LKELLRDPVSEQDIQKAWRGLQARRAHASASPSRWTVGWIAAGALAACIAFVLVWTTPSATSEPRELRTETGEPLEMLAGAETEPRAVQLSDGSRITLEPGAEAEVLENTDRSFVTKLRKGKTRFEVRPGGPRRWSVECSLATVEVVGTAFTVTRSERQVRVEVHKGIVLVRGERVPERVQRLTAGQHLELTEEPTPTAAPSPEPTPAPEPPAPTVQETAAPPPLSAAPPPVQPETWRAAAAKGDHASAYARLGDVGLEREARRARDIDTLLMLADVARQSGHPEQAAQMLEQAMRKHPRDSRAGLAAFTLGRLELETLGRPARAAEAFNRVISLGEPRSLQEDAHARLVQAHARAGAWEQAREAAARYEQLYPQGYRLQDVRRWAAGP